MIVQLHENQQISLSEPITIGALITAGTFVVDNWDEISKLLDFFPYNPKAPGEAARIATVRKRFTDNNLMPYRENGQIVSPRIGAANFMQLTLPQLKRYAAQIKSFEIPQFSDPAKYNPNNPSQVPRRVIARHQLVIASVLAAVEKRIKELEKPRGPIVRNGIELTPGPGQGTLPGGAAGGSDSDAGKLGFIRVALIAAALLG